MVEKPKREKRQKVKADPVLVAKARELRDRWLEKVNESGGASLLLGAGKYEVSKALSVSVAGLPSLPSLPVPMAA